MNKVSSVRTGTTRSSFASATGGFVATPKRTAEPKKPSVRANLGDRDADLGLRR